MIFVFTTWFLFLLILAGRGWQHRT